MAKTNGKKTKDAKPPKKGITHITVGGYKSIAREQTIEIRPLTVLAGANSSGKSSMMQPLLLLKQTLEAPYDPGALLLNGPNVKFTSVDQMMTRRPRGANDGKLIMGLAFAQRDELRLVFERDGYGDLELEYEKVTVGGKTSELSPKFSREELTEKAGVPEGHLKWPKFKYSVTRHRCLFTLAWISESAAPNSNAFNMPAAPLIPPIEQIIHLPGFRGNAERIYPRAAVAKSFQGTFENYFASVIANWTRDKRDERLVQLNDDLRNLGLTWKIEAKLINDAQLELKVARLPKSARNTANDLVNIADVGFGVSQTLPVVVALLTAEPGQLVYLEQPEIHLHPRAQVAMAQLLANAANRGVKVVVETHSSLLLLGIESLVAEEKLAQDKVILHWFERDNEGATSIRTGELDFAGRSGDWPEDFDDVSLEAQRRYLDAVDRRAAP